MKCGADGLPDCTCIGGTTDLAAGQLLDRAEICSVCRSRPAAHWTRWRLPPSRKGVQTQGKRV
ncbi:MAG: hypothetical protein ACLRVN_06390 [Butyricicoccus sp.]